MPRISPALLWPRFTAAGTGFLAALWLCPMLGLGESFRSVRPELRIGEAGHAFDHLGSIGEQAESAAASGAKIIYISGIGVWGYQGLPDSRELALERNRTAGYVLQAKRHGIRLAIGYVCATSIVNLENFDKNWTVDFRSKFRSHPAEWRQQDRQGQSLPSWYGGQYQPACMNNPDWRAYEKFVLRQQLEAGCDGIFFDNPTMHPQGCYCSHCMAQFAQFLRRELPENPTSNAGRSPRDLPDKYPSAFLRFRCTIARDFLAEMRAYARTIKPTALITANNSLNSVDVLFSQCRTYGYNIQEMSQAEDLVIVEDMANQPRKLPNGQIIEYGPTYKQVGAISHGRPVVAVTIAEADYHTPPNLVRLAMAEAAANNASYLSWPTWPESERARMISLIRPQADFLRTNTHLLNDTKARRDVVLFLPFRKWQNNERCEASRLARELSRVNAQYEVICEDDLHATEHVSRFPGKFPTIAPDALPESLRGARVLLAGESADFLPGERPVIEKFLRDGGRLTTAEKADWLERLQAMIGKPSILLQAPPTVRAILRDQPKRSVLHLLNLDVQRLSSFQDKVIPARDVRLTVRVPLRMVRSIRALTADSNGSSGPLKFSVTKTEGQNAVVETTLPRLVISAILVVE